MMKNQDDTLSSGGCDDDADVKQLPIDDRVQAPVPLQALVNVHDGGARQLCLASEPSLAGQQQPQSSQDSQELPFQEMQNLSVGGTGALPDAACLEAQELYTSVLRGNDETGEGTQSKPFKTLLQAVRLANNDPLPPVYVDGKEGGPEFIRASQSALKKAKKAWTAERKKAAKHAIKAKEKMQKEEQDAENHAKYLEDAKKIPLVEDPSKPAARRVEIHQIEEGFRGLRVKVFGWVHELRRQGKAGKQMVFIKLRDSSVYLQCILSGELCETFEALTLGTEFFVRLFGTLQSVPEGNKLPGGLELDVDYFQVIGKAPPGGIESVVNKDSLLDVQLDKRHLMIRGTKTSKALDLMPVIKAAFRAHYAFHRYTEACPPAIVQTQVEGGATLFELDYFGEPAFLTQSSQMYLEVLIPRQGNVYCIQKSFRAEKSDTKRHLSEFDHVEAECRFIKLSGLERLIEDLVVDVSKRVMASSLAQYVTDLNPNFKVPSKPFRRMTYSEAIIYLKENGITKEDGSFYEFGEDIPESAERKMTDKIGEPILLSRFPAAIKAFYMKKCPEDLRLTESVDLLLPGVGEVVGGSMRIEGEEELLAAFKNAGIDPAPYDWYIDTRIYGSFPHGGYGLGLERFICWMLKIDNVRQACFLSRTSNRCTP